MLIDALCIFNRPHEIPLTDSGDTHGDEQLFRPWSASSTKLPPRHKKYCFLKRNLQTASTVTERSPLIQKRAWTAAVTIDRPASVFNGERLTSTSNSDPDLHHANSSTQALMFRGLASN